VNKKNEIDMSLLDSIYARAKANKQRIVLPEGTEERTLKAADAIVEQGLADVILLGNKAEIEKMSAEFGLKNIANANVIDPENNPNAETYINLLVKLREKKGMTQEQLAEWVELSPMHVSVIERGVKLPKLETLINIANVLDVSADVLLQDVVKNQTKLYSSEASELIRKLPRDDQRRVLEALRSFVETT
jgi:transcriptional regulator with XRE-family HTH domain